MPSYHQTIQESKDPLNQHLNPKALSAIVAHKLVQSLRPDNLGRFIFNALVLLFYFFHYCCSLFALSLLSLTNWDNKDQEKCLYAARVSFLEVMILYLMHFRKGSFSVRFHPCWGRRKTCLKLFTSGQNSLAVHVGTEPCFFLPEAGNPPGTHASRCYLLT